MIEFEFDEDEIKRNRKRIEGLSPKKQNSIWHQIMRDITLKTEKKLKENISNKILHVRTGALRASIASRITGNGEEIEGTVGSGIRTGKRMVYANIHETGGVIRAKNPTGYLWIPIRRGGDIAIARGLSKRRISYSSKVLGYIKVRQVTIPKCEYMSKTVKDVMPEVKKIMNKRVEDYLK